MSVDQQPDEATPKPWGVGLTLAGPIDARALDIIPVPPPSGRARHRFGKGPFARLRMPKLPAEPGLYVCCLDGTPVYVGQTRGTLQQRLGSNGYATISTYNTFTREPGRRNGGLETNCRINALANEALRRGRNLTLWYRVTASDAAAEVEAGWMRARATALESPRPTVTSVPLTSAALPAI